MGTSVRQFNRNLKKMAKSLPATSLLAFHKKLAFDLFRKIILKTPVDTGRARGNWQMNVGTPLKNEKDTADRNGSGTVQNGFANLLSLSPFQTIFITNNVQYIGSLENGRSRQAPKGMVKVSIAEVNQGLI